MNVTYKIGYAMSQRKYYSWLGGVDAAFRRRGIASMLMQQQHDWLVGRRYTVVETSANRFCIPRYSRERNRKMAMKLYAHPFSSYCQKVLFALYENDTPFEFRMLAPDNPQAMAEHAALWPLKRMPLLVDGDRTVVEADCAADFPPGAPDRD